MKRLFALVMGLFLLVIYTNTALANPKENLKKLAVFIEKTPFVDTNIIIEFPLTSQEVDEIVAWLKEAYVKENIEATDNQIALMAGVLVARAVEQQRKPTKKSNEEKKTSNIPNFDIEKYCKGMSEFSGGSYTIESSCINMEKKSKQQIIDMKNVPDKIFQYCQGLAEAGGESYVLFKGCIDMELRSKEQLNK